MIETRRLKDAVIFLETILSFVLPRKIILSEVLINSFQDGHFWGCSQNGEAKRPPT